MKTAVAKRVKTLRAEQDARVRDQQRLERLRQDERLRRQAENDVRAEEARKAEARAERAEAEVRASDPAVMLTYRGLLIIVKDTVAADTVIRQTAVNALAMVLNRLRQHNTKVVWAARCAAKGVTADKPETRELLKSIIEDECRYAIKNGSLTVTLLEK